MESHWKILWGGGLKSHNFEGKYKAKLEFYWRLGGSNQKKKTFPSGSVCQMFSGTQWVQSSVNLYHEEEICKEGLLFVSNNQQCTKKHIHDVFAGQVGSIWNTS